MEKMRKKYNKPKIEFESFELTSNIASCNILGSNSAQYVCAVDDQTGTTIFSDEGICDYTPPDGDRDTICYDVPLGTLVVFGS